MLWDGAEGGPGRLEGPAWAPGVPVWVGVPCRPSGCWGAFLAGPGRGEVACRSGCSGIACGSGCVCVKNPLWKAQVGGGSRLCGKSGVSVKSLSPEKHPGCEDLEVGTKLVAGSAAVYPNLRLPKKPCLFQTQNGLQRQRRWMLGHPAIEIRQEEIAYCKILFL